MSEPKLTPMMQQYVEVKRTLPPNTLLLFRLGDFYELFHDDAVVGAKILGITLTKRHEMPMAGIPYHAADNYVGKLLAAGKKVAICEQQEAAKPGKLVRRALTRILSPGTTLAANQLDATRNHYLCALNIDANGFHAAWMDLSTGEFKIATDTRAENLLPVLTSLDPAEIIVIEGVVSKWKSARHEETALHTLRQFTESRLVSEIPEYHFETAGGAKVVMETLGVLNLQGFGIGHDHFALGCAGAVVHYATENLCAKPENLRVLQEYRSSKALLLDPATLRNLEIFQSARGGREGTLFDAINRANSSMGARLLERWLTAPLLHLGEIERRQSVVGELMLEPTSLAELKELLAQVRDIPRILGRLQNRLRNPRELGGVRDTLKQIPPIRGCVLNWRVAENLSEVAARLSELPDICDLLSRALRDELPADLTDGQFIRPGYDPELDRLLGLTSNNKTWLSALERQEQERAGIKSLKVRFTNNFGYYIEVTKANLHLVPPNYIRRQTTVNGERYVTEELRHKEKEIFHAEENALARENELFQDLIARVLQQSAALQETAEALAELDVFCGWASLAREWNYCRPKIDETDRLEIIEGRHPVVEQMLRSPDMTATIQGHQFVPNDTTLGSDEIQIALLTGPNMAGKSTFIRQVALISLMAHVGSWVPATRCHIGLIDRIFSRVGASDDLARGNSTFMVEMNETANILNNATDRSLIILDEIGRGTSTYDGLSIAWAVVEHLHRSSERGPRTLFATHYQELTQLSKYLPRMRNYSVAVKEWNDEIVFVRRVVEGPADRSYGIQVARLAGLPLSVIDRAKTILQKLESDDATVSVPGPLAKPKKKISIETPDDSQMNLL